VAHLSNDDNVQQEQETEKDGVRQKKSERDGGIVVRQNKTGF